MPTRRRLPFEAVLPASALVLVSAALAAGFPAALDLPVRDALLRLLPSRPVGEVAVVAVDETSLAEAGPWPWPRARLAALVGAARVAGARGVVLDLLLVEPADGDDVLASSLRGTPAVLAAGLDARSGWLLPAPALRGAARLAHATFDVDHDGVARRFRSTRQRDGLSLPALSVAAASLAEPSRPTPVGRLLVPSFRSRPRDVPVVGAADLLAGRGTEPLRDRVVLVGVTAAGLGDRTVCPGSPAGTPEAGVLVHAAATEGFLSGALLRPLPPLVPGLLAALLTGAVLLAARARRRRPLLAASLLLPPLCGAALLAAGVEPPVATLSLATLLAVLVVEARAARRGEAVAARVEARRAEEREARRAAVHELKTPLTAVRGLAQLLAGVELTEAERARVAAMVGEETERLGGLIESLNAVEKMRLADFRAAARPVDLGTLAARRAEALGAGTGRVAATVEDGVVVTGDEALLARVLDNLVGNALKFSPAGTPVRVGVARRGNEAVLSVTDEGPGIPEDERARVFGRFERGGGAEGVEGLGLGLSLVAEVVTWHGGRVSVTGAGAKGSLFEVVLPAARRGEEDDAGEHPRR